MWNNRRGTIRRGLASVGGDSSSSERVVNERQFARLSGTITDKLSRPHLLSAFNFSFLNSMATRRFCLLLITLFCLPLVGLFAQKVTPIPAVPMDVYVIPITGAIGTPNLYILRRGLKEAIVNDVGR